MSTGTNDIPVRSARDRIIDLLGIGDSYPLTDLNVVTDQLKVAFGGTARIPIESAQVGVTYQLIDPAGKLLGKADGNDDTLVIETPRVEENVTYRISATKQQLPGSKLPPQAPRYLDQSASVKVGIDSQLAIEILHASPLDPAKTNPSDPRIVAYGDSVAVKVNSSQEGVEYSLMVDGNDASEPVTGDLHDIILTTSGPMHEDVVIEVRATKKFRASENRSTESSPLDEKLYLKVKADPALTISVEPSPIVDYRQDATINIADTQAGVEYQAYMRGIADVDFVRGVVVDGDVVADSDIVKVLVNKQPDVRVRKPARLERWYRPEGYTPFGDGPLPGTGGDLTITAQALTDDTIVIVQASKKHQVDADATATITSEISLDQAAVVLVRPDPEHKLRLRVPVTGTKTGDTMLVLAGQPGVFYYLRRGVRGAKFPLPAYFHKRDAQDDTQNKGLGQLGVEVDFVVADDPDANRDTAPDLATTFPRPPTLDITPTETNSKISANAVKAQTAVEAKMAQAAQIAAVPAISADPAVIDFGGTAKILIPASKPEDQYHVMLDGTLMGSALTGDNTDLTVITDPLDADAIFEVLVTPIADDGIQVERVVKVSVFVLPDAAMSMSAQENSVSNNIGTDIVLEGSQEGVNYQLMSGQTAIGSAVPGTGAEIILPTGPISADTTFSVTATRADDARLAVVLQAQATVMLEPDD
jgi:hypothetical protein